MDLDVFIIRPGNWRNWRALCIKRLYMEYATY